MAAILLLPGIGGKYTSETFDVNSTTGADTIDVSRCGGGFLVQVTSTGGGGTFQMQHSINGTLWAALGTAIDPTTSGTMSRFDMTTGPYGLLRIDATNVTGTCSVEIVGWELASVA